MSDPRKVFVIHGRNEKLRADFFSFLRALGLQPIEWSEALGLTKKASPYIGETLEAAFAEVQAVIVLLSPDDEVRLSPALCKADEDSEEKEFRLQPRPNVLFEAGRAFGTHADRTLLIEVGSVKRFSDIAGRHAVRLSDNPDSRLDVAQRLKTIGCPVSMDGKDWLKEGQFVCPDLPSSSAAAPAPSKDSSAGPRPNVRLIDAPNEAGYHHLHIKNFGSAGALDIVLVALKADPSIQTYVPIGQPILLQSLDAGEQRYAFGTMFSTDSSLVEDPMLQVYIEYDDAFDNHYQTTFEGRRHRSGSILERTIPLEQAGGAYEALDSLDGKALEETLGKATDAEREGYLDDLRRSGMPGALSLDKTREAILVAVCQCPDMTDGEVAATVSTNEQVATFHLNELQNAKLIRSRWVTGSGWTDTAPRTEWYITQEGRSYLFSHGLLG